jgi:hypothetical protein
MQNQVDEVASDINLDCFNAAYFYSNKVTISDLYCRITLLQYRGLTGLLQQSAERR